MSTAEKAVIQDSEVPTLIAKARKAQAIYEKDRKSVV